MERYSQPIKFCGYFSDWLAISGPTFTERLSWSAIDKDDVPIISAALANNNCAIWSDDFHLQKQKTIKVLTTKEIIEKS